MSDFERARQSMVDNQLRTSAVTDWRILTRMAAVPREAFVNDARRPVAYIDDVQWLGEPDSKRFMPAPATFAKLVQLAEVLETDSVLDIGAGTGYSAAVLAGLAATVTGIEPDAQLAAVANANLANLGITNAKVVAGDIGLVAKSTFDVIIVEGALDQVPAEFFARLSEGGRLVALIRTGVVAVANVYVKSGEGISARAEFNAMLPSFFSATRVDEFVF
ncbi:hypothetical protein WH87_04560 [Devosia epidermidihirudinis]|uniref:Protein-L-isoaspartate O-methyltransferase n=1 Tax=Devosia epidermidihirudinis TaxID=1293439 RepID=A0A0F5QEQ5_9HYPH|nr:protein-L-isoaspartate O-methyltransferase [Devosia epidermidihirudinis]KKC39477.1 hypothetical protein WH87_04560 [Devosia epidermidihirudinis]